MKYLLPLLALFSLLLLSCKKDDVNPEVSSLSSDDYVQAHVDPGYRGDIVSVEKVGTYSKDDLQSLIDIIMQDSELGLPDSATLTLSYDIDLYKIIYKTLDWNNEEVLASGALAVPVGQDSVRFTCYHHGTVTKNKDAPSQQTGNDIIQVSGEARLGILMAGMGFGVAMPDYLGIGEWDPDRIPVHPYQHRKTEAIASIDMMRASRSQLQTLGVSERPGGAVLLGYSQGGHATAASMWDIQDYYSNEFEILGAIPMSGAHSMSGVMRDLIVSAQPYSHPMFIAYLLHAYNMIYEVYDGPGDYFKPEYADTSYQLLFDRAPVSTIDSVMPSAPIDAILDEMRTEFESNPDFWFTAALKGNDTYTFTPRSPVNLIYCTQDEQVPYQNSLFARDEWKARGADVRATNVGDLEHVPCIIPAIYTTKIWVDSLEAAQPVIE